MNRAQYVLDTVILGYGSITEKIFVDAYCEVNKIWTPLLREKIRTILLSVYNAYPQNKKKFTQELLRSLNSVHELQSNNVIFELGSKKATQKKILFSRAQTVTAPPDDYPVGHIIIYVNETHHLPWMADPTYIEEVLASLASLLCHEMTHRLQYGTLQQGRFHSLPFVTKLKVLYHDRRGVFLPKKGKDTYRMGYSEIAAFANSTAYDIIHDKHNADWKEEILEYVLNQPTKTAALFITTVYNLLLKHGMTHEDIEKIFLEVENDAKLQIRIPLPKRKRGR